MLAGCARITGYEVYVQMRHLVTNGVQIHVLRALCVSKQTGHSAAGSAEGRGFLVGKVAHAGYMPFGLDDELAAIGGRSWSIDVSDINEVILV
jgi:hypothetical protein